MMAGFLDLYRNSNIDVETAIIKVSLYNFNADNN